MVGGMFLYGCDHHNCALAVRQSKSALERLVAGLGTHIAYSIVLVIAAAWEAPHLVSEVSDGGSSPGIRGPSGGAPRHQPPRGTCLHLRRPQEPRAETDAASSSRRDLGLRGGSRKTKPGQRESSTPPAERSAPAVGSGESGHKPGSCTKRNRAVCCTPLAHYNIAAQV